MGKEELIEDEITVESNDYPCSTNNDYSPANPWDAPGMSVKDFI